jgi:hypothetical protein
MPQPHHPRRTASNALITLTGIPEKKSWVRVVAAMSRVTRVAITMSVCSLLVKMCAQMSAVIAIIIERRMQEFRKRGRRGSVAWLDLVTRFGVFSRPRLYPASHTKLHGLALLRV